MTFLHSVESILTIVILFMTGFFMTRAGWLDGKTSETFAKIIMNVALPCDMLWNITANFTRGQFVEMSRGLLVPFLSIGSCYLLSIAASRLLRIPAGRRGVFRSIFFTSNTIFIGLPVNLALFGEKSTPYVLLYYIVNTTFFWTVGVFEISRDGTSGEKPRLFSRSSLRRILSPALLGFLLGIVLVLLGVSLPSFLSDSAKYLGQLTTPLAMLFIGIVMCSVRLRDIRLSRELVVLIIARFVICPLSLVFFEHFLRLPPLMAKVFILQSAMPAMTNTGVVAKAYGADYKFGSLVTVITTFLSMLAIPLYMLLL